MIWPEQVIDFARKPGVHTGLSSVFVALGGVAGLEIALDQWG
jgi:hypothetical protein